MADSLYHVTLDIYWFYMTTAGAASVFLFVSADDILWFCVGLFYCYIFKCQPIILKWKVIKCLQKTVFQNRTYINVQLNCAYPDLQLSG